MNTPVAASSLRMGLTSGYRRAWVAWVKAYLHYYRRAGDEYGLDWTRLAAVGQIELDQGRSQKPASQRAPTPPARAATGAPRQPQGMTN